MNSTMLKIEELKKENSIINFKEHLSDSDYRKIEENDNKIVDLFKQLKGKDFVALKLTHKKFKYSFYLTSDKSLCCSDSETWFDNEEEALEYLNNSELDKENYDYEFVRNVDYE